MRKVTHLSVVLLGLWLTACGAERDEPFNPDDGLGVDEPEGDPVAVTSLTSGTNPFVEFGGKRLEVMKNLNDYLELLDQYTEAIIPDPNFSRGQVLLYDGGPTDDNVCVRKLILRQVEAQTLNDDLVEVTLEYEDFVPQTGPCDDDIFESRPFEFFYIESRSDLVIREEVQNLRRDDDEEDDEGLDDEDEDDDLGNQAR